MQDQFVPSTSMRRLNACFEKEQRENGLVEMAFCPGSDREVCEEEAAEVALRMIDYADKRRSSIDPGDTATSTIS